MKLSLPGKAETRPSVEAFNRSAGHPFHRKTRALGRLSFFFQLFPVSPWRNEQKSVQSFEITFNVLTPDDGFNGIDGGGVALSRQPRPLSSMQPLQFIVAIIQGI